MTVARGLVDAFHFKDDYESTRETRLTHHHYFAEVALTYSIEDDTVGREIDPSERRETIYPMRQYLRFFDDSVLMLEFSKEGYIQNIRIYEEKPNGYTEEN